MGPNELVQMLNDMSSQLHDCGKQSFATEQEVEAWHAACGAMDSLRGIVVARMRETPGLVKQVERRGLVSRLIGRVEDGKDQSGA